MYSNKKAMTLLETVIYLALLSVVIGLFSVSVNYFKEKDNSIKIDNEISEIKYFLLEAKVLCNLANARGEVIYISEKNSFKFEYNNKGKYLNLDKLKAKKPINITINDKGFLYKPVEIQFVDENNKKYTVKLI